MQAAAKRLKTSHHKITQPGPDQDLIVDTIERFYPKIFRSLGDALKAADGYELILRMETVTKHTEWHVANNCDNIRRRWVLVRRAVNFTDNHFTFPMRGCSFHEVIPEGRPVKPWFDLDGFDTSVTNDEMIATFTECWLNFFSDIFGGDDDDEELDEGMLRWAECTRTDRNGEVTKNSLHATMQGCTVANNEVAMKALAQQFIHYIRDAHRDSTTPVIEALLEPGVIDLAVYNKNRSIRVVGSPKLGEYESPIRMVDNVDANNTPAMMYVSCHFTGDEQPLPSIDITPSSTAQPDAAAIIRDALQLPDATIKSIRHIDEFYSCVTVTGYTKCTRGGTTHSHDDDVYFIISAFDPVVKQLCHSARCAKLAAFEGRHTTGLCKAITTNPTYDDLTPTTYINACLAVVGKMTTDEGKPLNAGAQRQAMDRWYKVLFTCYYNRFFAMITAEAKALVAIDLNMGRRWVVAPTEFKHQYVGLGIDKWLTSPLRKSYKRFVHIPWSDDMIEMGCCSANGCKNPDFTNDADMLNIEDDEHRPEDTGEEDFNLFIGLGIPHRDAYEYMMDDPAAIRAEVKPIIDHITKVWCGGHRECARWVIQWLAINYLQPWKKNSTAIVLHSGKGTGKGIIMSKMRELLNGSDSHGLFWQINTLDPIVGNYQPAAMMECGLLFADECVWSGDPRVANRVKGLVTEELGNCNVKYRPFKPYRSHMNIVIASNNDRAVEVTVDNRRFQMLDMKKKEFETDEAKERYFNKIGQVPAVALAAFFMRCVCLCDFNSSQMFNNGQEAADGIINSNHFDAWWHDLIAGESELDLFAHDRYPLMALRSDYKSFARGKRGARSFPTVASFAKALRPRLNMTKSDGWTRTARDNSGNRVSALRVPSKEDAQKAFNLYTGQTFFE